MRNRLEDLGRVLVKLQDLSKNELFEMYDGSPKYFTDWFEALPQEKKEDFLHQLPYKLQYFEEKLYEILEICEGSDYLNETPD